MEEIYKGLIYQGKDYSHRLEVSNYGNIRNVKTQHIYRISNSSGYASVCISMGSRNDLKLFKPHKAVAETFIPNPLNLPQVNHKDGNKMNAHVANLEWVTASQNVQHAFDTGLHKMKIGIESKSSKLTKEEVDYVCERYIPKDRMYGGRALGRKFGVSHDTISRTFMMNNILRDNQQ